MKKFNKEIDLLKNLREDASALHALHPLIKAQLKNKILTDLKTTTPQEATRSSRQGRRQKLIRFIISILSGLSLIGGTAFASNNAVPGDALYPVKQIKETIELNLAPSESSKAQLQVKFAGERLNELTKVHAQAQAQIRTQGKIEADTAQAENQAQDELKNAVEILTHTQAQLEAKGNVEAATSIGQALLRLQGKHEGEIEVEIRLPQKQQNKERNQEANPNNNLESNVEPATNTPIQNKIRINSDEQGHQNNKIDDEPRKNSNNATESQNNLNNNLNDFLGN